MPLARSRHPAILAALAALAALLLTGCNADPAAAPTPLPTVSPAPTVGAFTKSPEPEPARETAKEFIRRWPLVETAMVNSGETDEFRQYADGCRPCLDLADQVDRFYSKGGFVSTRGWRIISLRRGKGPSVDSSVFHISATAAPTRYKKSATAAVKTLKGGALHYRVELKSSPTGWTLTDYQNEHAQ